MTPKERATELVDKYITTQRGFFMPNKVAIECAKIAVDEIIDVIINMFGDNTGDYNYWQEVKQEIEKI